jgi:hypothetical protein
MAKLNKRQIIILVLMGMFVIYGAYIIFFAPPAGEKTQQAKYKNTPLSGNMVTILTSSPLDKIDGYIIARAEAGWQKSPFWDKNIYKQWAVKDETKSAQPEAKIVYSGYVDAGKKKMAIINGIEYTEGEKLEVEGYVLKSIRPAKIKVENKNTGSEVEILLQE